MSDFDELREVAEALRDQIDDLLNSENPSDYEQTENYTGELKSLSRELLQDRQSESYEGIVGKLEAGEDLSDDEIEQVRALINGVGAVYTQIEDSVKYWKAELEEFQLEIKKVLDDSPIDDEALLELQAFCEEAEKFLPDLRNFYTHKQQVDRLTETLREGYSSEEGHLLAKTIRDKMLSDHR